MVDATWSDVVDNLGRLSEIVNTVYTEQRRRRDPIWVICPIFTGNSCPNPLCDHSTAHPRSGTFGHSPRRIRAARLRRPADHEWRPIWLVRAWRPRPDG